MTQVERLEQVEELAVQTQETVATEMAKMLACVAVMRLEALVECEAGFEAEMRHFLQKHEGFMGYDLSQLEVMGQDFDKLNKVIERSRR